ncbi:MAG: YifB family Mg chelatase-like AAA ATPase [Acidobacteria bacterium]|nr:YifB family Mg chelatase-like AAA ATPase [Acidobacteriota bacterium]
MMSRVFSACPLGVNAEPVQVEADVRDARQLTIHIVGLPDAATREAKDRLVPALTNSGYALHTGEIVINLSPADMRKEGCLYDLPMAVAILSAIGVIPPEALTDVLFIGELALDGQTRPVRSAIACAESARACGFSAVIVPQGNGEEASLVPGIAVYEAANLAQAAAHLRGTAPLEICQPRCRPHSQPSELDFMEVKGQTLAKRVLEIAAAGGHNLLMYGPPGSGKSMLSKRFPSLLPDLTHEEFIEVTRIYSCAGTSRNAMDQSRPFRAPHHTASPIAMIGGGTVPRPGEVTLAHKGVLFLDEFPEFPRVVLEVLRQPMEDRHVTISRASLQVTFPADFTLIAAMNPCPCGWRGDPRRHCHCSPGQVRAYRSRISGPIIDRIDMHIEVPVVSMRAIRKLPPAESSATIRQRVRRAREIQSERFGLPGHINSRMSAKQMKQHCVLSDSIAEQLDRAMEKLGFSTRVHDKVVRVARTIADLQGAAEIEYDHVFEALSYRTLDRQLRAQYEPTEVRS